MNILSKCAGAALPLMCAVTMLSSCQQPEEITQSASTVSPGANNSIEFFITDAGQPGYFVQHNGQVVVDSSLMSFDFKNQPALKEGMEILNISSSIVDETWQMPWGEQLDVKNHCQESVVRLGETTGLKRHLVVYMRAYDDGVAFRYEFETQEGVDSLTIMDENSQFKMTGDHLTWWTPGDWDTYEHVPQTSHISQIDAMGIVDKNLFGTKVPDNAVHTPFTLRTAQGTHLVIHEANLTDYAGMTVKIEPDNMLVSELVGSDRLNHKVKRALPFKTPWRTIQIADQAEDLVESNLIVNLNEPNKLGDVSWFQPMKYMGIWWEMHIAKSSWDYEAIEKGGAHGANTENAKRYIDFAAANGFGGVLVEGWNTGWLNWFSTVDREGMFDFVTPYPDYDLMEVNRYAQEKGLQLIMHNETAAAVRTYDNQLDTAYKLMQHLGIHSVKTGYVKNIMTEGEYHHGQYMVNHYRRVALKGAEHQVAVNAHEPIKATGLRRTYPNIISREGARGQEFNAWASDGGNRPEHTSIIAFTRLLGGPMDFTPGVFDITLPSKPNNQVNTTLAHQLALYVVLYSPIQMACDLPENYEGQPAFQFIKDVGVNWETTVGVDAEVGDFVVTARKERETGNWFVGGVSDEQARNVEVNFDFLDAGAKYEATVYMDGPAAHYKNNPKDIAIESFEVDATTKQTFSMVEGGGFAISLKKIE